ncbi:MAG: cytochrome c3 family protein, partial [Gemmatimonadales bacterium]
IHRCAVAGHDGVPGGTALMAALFRPAATPAGRSALIAALFAVVAAPTLIMVWVRTSWARGERTTVAQPIPFSHALHAGTFRIDCRYCHSEVEWSASAGMPPSDRCVTCHQTKWMASPALAPVRASLANGTPVPWQRVTQLPQFVYFNHAMHVRHGVGCETCHGRVDRMTVDRQVVPLTMGWCVSCHRDPEPHLRPQSAITTMGWSPASLSPAERQTLTASYGIHHYTNCTTCHR